ncbi:MAG: hypothetical protein KKB31_05515 [Nanoarchaeota archaeon]|nr:hypothetical protein [Nanoarchaeota archaeon]
MKYQTSEEAKFAQFISEIKKYDKIDTRTLEMLIARISPNKKFFNLKHKISYYRFWIKRIHQAGIIIQHPNIFGMWIVKNGDSKKND